eukprot:24484_1
MSLQYAIKNTSLLVIGYVRENESKLAGFPVVPISVTTMLSIFVQFGDFLHSRYTRRDLKITEDNTVEKVYHANIWMDWSWLTGFFKTMLNAKCTYEWSTRWMKVIRCEWYIGIIDSNDIEPQYWKRDEITKEIICFGGDGYGTDYNNYLLWNGGANELLDTTNYKSGKLETFWLQNAYENVYLQDMDTITIRLECDGTIGKLSYIHNGTNLGVAFDNIDLGTQWSFAVVLFREGEKVKLEQFQQISDTKLYFQ